MSIQKYQIDNKTKEAVINLLRKGNVVTSYEVSKDIYAYFETYQPGLPVFKPVVLKPFTKAKKDDLNKMFLCIGKDMQTAFDVLNEACRKSILRKEKFNIETFKLNKMVDEIIIEYETLKKYVSKKTAFVPKVMNFYSLENVNTDDKTKNNIPLTNCEFDFYSSTARCENLSPISSKIDLTKSKVTILSKHKSVNCKIINESNMFNENNINPTVIKTTSNNDEMHSISIEMTLEKPVEMSCIKINGAALGNVETKLILSNDIDKLTLDNRMLNSSNEWRFNKMVVSNITMFLSKISYDYISNLFFDKKYTCYFIINNFEAYNEIFAKLGTLVTKDISFNNYIDKVTLYPTHTMPPRTDISYYIGVEDNNKDIEWKTIKPKEPLDLKLLYEENLILNPFTSKQYGVSIKNDKNDILYYKLKDLPEYSNINTIDIRTGYAQWNIEALYVKDKYNSEIPTDKKVHIEDYNKKYIVGTAPVDTNIMEIKLERKNNYFVFTQYVICDKEYIVTDRFFNYDVRVKGESEEEKNNPLNKEIFDYKIIVNGKVIEKDEKNRFTFKFVKGENTVNIMFLLCNAFIDDSLPIIKHNFNFSAYSTEIYGCKSMYRVNHEALVEVVNKNEHRCYSLVEKDGKISINTKFNPNNFEKPTDVEDTEEISKTSITKNIKVDEEGFPQDGPYKTDKVYKDLVDICINNGNYYRTRLRYKHLTEKNLIKFFNNNKTVKVRIMAQLRSSDNSVTPYINSLALVGE